MRGSSPRRMPGRASDERAKEGGRLTTRMENRKVQIGSAMCAEGMAQMTAAAICGHVGVHWNGCLEHPGCEGSRRTMTPID